MVGALVDTLADRDRLELIEFSSAPRRWKPAAVAATDDARRDAHAWLRALRASGRPLPHVEVDLSQWSSLISKPEDCDRVIAEVNRVLDRES